MVNYQNGKIYKLWSIHTDKVYIGSTCNLLSKRFNEHKRKTDTTSRELLEYGEVKIELIESFSCNSEIREYQQKYRDNHKEDIKEYSKHYVENNKENKANYDLISYQNNKKERIQKQKEYAENNKDRIKKYKKEYYKLKKEKTSENYFL